MKSAKAALIFINFFSFIVLNAQNINTATNGLTKSGTSVLLGGTLTQSTSIDLGSSFTFKFSKGTSNHFYLGNNGNIGIGTDIPSAQLHTTGSVRFQGLTNNPSPTNILVADATGNLSWKDASTGLVTTETQTFTGNKIFNNQLSQYISNPAYPFHVAPVQYSSGMASQSGITITGSSVLWTNGMQGSYLVFADGTRRTITAFIDQTHLTVAESGTVSNQAYKIHYPGLGVASNGKTTIATSEWVEDMLTVQSGIGTWGSGVAKFVSVSPYASGNYNTIVCAFAPNVPLGAYINAYQFGKDRVSTNNSATWAFRYNGDMSLSNYVTLAFWGSQEIVRFNPNGVTELNGDIYTGNGITNPSPASKIISATGGSGTDIAGANLMLAAGKGTGGAAGGYLDFQTSDAGTSGASLQSLTSKMRIMSNGNVGIGTTNPGPYKLAVEGTIGARKVKVTQVTPWADYVFNDDYPLMSLKELDHYIHKHNHLPDVPTASEVEKNGVDLGDNQAILLRKIEELTLYIIDQNKKLEEQKKRIEALEQQAEKKKNK